MIKVHPRKYNGIIPIYLNPSCMVSIELDQSYALVTMVTGEKHYLRESVEEVLCKAPWIIS